MNKSSSSEDEEELQKRRRQEETIESDDEGSEDDQLLHELEVRVANNLQHAEAFAVQFPVRKANVFDSSHTPRARYKKNVKLLEMRLSANVQSGSYDRDKARVMHSSIRTTTRQGTSAVKTDPHSETPKNEEIFEGRAFQTHQPVVNAFGCIKDGSFIICPLSGTIEMRKTLVHLNQKKTASSKSTSREEEMMEESDSETTPSASQTVRVKFAKPETERQKKRREASALYREKMIANDSWIEMSIECSDSPQVTECVEKMAAASTEEGANTSSVGEWPADMRTLVNRTILAAPRHVICVGEDATLDPEEKVLEVPWEEQVVAQMIKCQVMKTSNLTALLPSDIRREDLLRRLQQCAHLVRGVWVVKSEYLFENLPPAHCNVSGKRDEHRERLWREARDLGLALLDARQRLTRNTLIRCFRLNESDVEQILSTFAVKADRCWKLRLEPDAEFLQDPVNLLLILYESRFWFTRWEEIKANMEKSASPRRVAARRIKKEILTQDTLINLDGF